jgi:Glycosyltransferase Family 4
LLAVTHQCHRSAAANLSGEEDGESRLIGQHLPMRIAQIAPLYECVPPKLYGGTERIVSYLTEELVRQGHEVTLFASGDSKTSAKLVPCCDTAVRLNPLIHDPLPYHIIMLEEADRGLTSLMSSISTSTFCTLR